MSVERKAGVLLSSMSLVEKLLEKVKDGEVTGLDIELLKVRLSWVSDNIDVFLKEVSKSKGSMGG